MEKRVAVIGGGSSGLVAARELLRQGHSVVVFEKGKQIGGTWIYDQQEGRFGVGSSDSEQHHSSMYRSLRTNLPREVMGFSDYPFSPHSGCKDSRRYPGHEEVLDYLERFAAEFGILEFVRLNSRVEYVGLLKNDGSEVVNWIVKTVNSAKENQEVFDAVVVCNGHFFQPRFASIPGIENWPGRQCHSHNYRVPEQFKNQVVAVIGNAPSGQDISTDLAAACKKVHWCAKSWDPEVDLSKPLLQGKIQRHLMVSKAEKDGRLYFKDGTSAVVDVILHCTGYLYDFSFLDTDNYVTVDDNRVGPLYKHVFPPALAPSLSFVGLTWKSIPFPLSELQSKWIAAALNGRVCLPSASEMEDNVEEFYRALENAGTPKRYTHSLDMEMFNYAEWLAKQCGQGSDGMESWKRDVYLNTRYQRKISPYGYRDE